MQLYCHAQCETLYERYEQRDNSGERHPWHIVLEGGFEEIDLEQVYDEVVKNIF